MAYEGCARLGGVCDCGERPCAMPWSDSQVAAEIEECERLEEEARTAAALQEEQDERDRILSEHGEV